MFLHFRSIIDMSSFSLPFNSIAFLHDIKFSAVSCCTSSIKRLSPICIYDNSFIHGVKTFEDDEHLEIDVLCRFLVLDVLNETDDDSSPELLTYSSVVDESFSFPLCIILFTH